MSDSICYSRSASFRAGVATLQHSGASRHGGKNRGHHAGVPHLRWVSPFFLRFTLRFVNGNGSG